MDKKLQRQQIVKAAKALIQLKEEEQEFIFLNVTTKTLSAKKSLKPSTVPLVHPIYQDVSVCLFVKDGVELQMPSVTVMSISELKKNYKPFEAKRQLLASFDIFLVDDRVMPLLPGLLGRKFFDKKKQPASINIKENAIMAVQKVLSGTFLVKNMGACNTVKVAVCNMTEEQIADNVLFAAQNIVEKMGQWKNIQSLHLKTRHSMALPIFNQL